MSSGEGTLTAELTHVVYTRSAAGEEKIYINGDEIVSGNREGDFSNWSSGYFLGISNEITGDHPWLGEFHLLAVYNRTLSRDEVLQNYEAN